MFETYWGGIVNLEQALQVFVEDNNGAFEVQARFAATDGVLNDENGLGELWIHICTVYTGSREECYEFIAWVKDELGVKRYPKMKPYPGTDMKPPADSE